MRGGANATAEADPASSAAGLAVVAAAFWAAFFPLTGVVHVDVAALLLFLQLQQFPGG